MKGEGLNISPSERRKRKRSGSIKSDEAIDQRENKRQKEENDSDNVISEVDFKFLLRDPETVSEGLEKFIQSTEAVASGHPSPDIVAGYCRSSPACSELFALIDPVNSQLKMSETVLVFRCLEKILSRVRTDLIKLSSTGEAVVQKILAAHMRQLFSCLQEQNKSKTIKAGLQLLIAMVTLSQRAKKAVQSRLNFGHIHFPPLFKRRNRKDPQDVRSCAVQLTLAFLLDSDHSDVSMLVQQKSFLQQTIAGLKYDRRDMVENVLATLLAKVVSCSGITKTDKVKLFSETVLKQLSDLYDWLGPAGWTAAGKKGQKSGDQTRELPETFTEDKEVIASVVHEFLMELCCSHKNGLNFYDKLVGTGQRNHNQLLGHFLEWLAKQMEEPRKAGLITGILCACPDLITATLKKLSPSLVPRWSHRWTQLMSWLIQLYKKLPDIPAFITSPEYLKGDEDALVSMATVFCLPPASVTVHLVQGLKHEDIRVRDTCIQLIQVLVKKACAIRDTLLSSVQAPAGVAAQSRIDDIANTFSACIMKALPAVGLLFACVDKAMLRMSALHQKENKLEASLLDEQGSSIDLSQHASVLLQVLNLYQTLIPSLLSDRPKDLAKLIDMVGCLQALHRETGGEGVDACGGKTDEESHEGEGQTWLPQLYLLKLLSEADAKKISLGREGLLEKLLQSASKNDKFKDLTITLVCKMLLGMEIFVGHTKELHTWLEVAINSRGGQGTEKKAAPSVSFLASCLSALINNPSPYVDRVLETVSDTDRLAMDEEQDMATMSTGTSESAIETILLMDDAELDNKLDKCKPLATTEHSDIIHLPVSPLVLVALDNLQFSKTMDGTQKEYISKVLVCLLHMLPNPAILASLVTKSEAKLCRAVRPYLQFWAGGKSKVDVTEPLPSAIFGVFTSKLMCRHFGLESSSDLITELSNEMNGMSKWEKLIGLKQILLYVEDILHASKQPNSKCREALQSYLHLAESLAGQLSEEESQITENIDLPKHNVSSSISNNNAHTGADVENNENSVVIEVDVFDVLFSKVSIGTSENVAADGLRCILYNQTLQSWLFKSLPDFSKKSDKLSNKKSKLAHTESVSECVSQFINNIITRCRKSFWFKSEIGLLDECLNILLDRLANRKKLSPNLEEICANTIESLSPLLDLKRLSRCIVCLLGPSRSSAIHEGQVDDDLRKDVSLNSATSRMFCELLKNAKSLIENDESFISSIQLSGCVCPTDEDDSGTSRSQTPDQKSAAVKGCARIRTRFSFEKSTGQSPSAFAPVFELLPHSNNSDLSEFVVFVLGSVPEMVPFFRLSLFGELFIDPSMLQRNSQKEKLFVCLVKNVRGCFLLFEDWLLQEARAAVRSHRWNLITIYLEANSIFSGGYTKTAEAVKHYASLSFKKLDAASISQSVEFWKCLSLTVQKHDPNFQQLLTNTIISHIRTHKDCQVVLFTVLKVSAGFCVGHSKTDGVAESTEAVVLDLVLDYLPRLIVRETQECPDIEEHILTLALRMAPSLTKTDWKNLTPGWLQLVQNTLRLRLTDARLLKLVAHLGEAVLSSGGHTAVSTCELFQQCVSHPQFHTVATLSQHADVKAELVKLLQIFGELDPVCYSQPQFISMLAPAYSASLSVTDQRLLAMMERCQRSGQKFECPVLWGKSALDQQAVSEVLGSSLDRSASVQAVLEQFNVDIMQDSILNFPVRRFHLGGPVADASAFKSKPECYDPRFLLRLFVQILSPDKQVPLRLFVEHGCLSYLLMALASHDPYNRLLAYQALNDFYVHSEASRWKERMEITFILDLLNASRAKDGQKLSFVVALFFARAVKLMLYPAGPMYVPIFRFLLAKPEVDLANVPEFYRLFYSAGSQYKHERNWMLSLLCDGMKETSDYWLYQKKSVFKLVFSFYLSAISDAHSQEQVLHLVQNACKENSVAVDLVKNHGLMSWLTAAVVGLNKRPEQTDILCGIIHTLWFSLTTARYNQSQPASEKLLTATSDIQSYIQAKDEEEDSSEDETSTAQKRAREESDEEAVRSHELDDSRQKFSDADEATDHDRLSAHKDKKCLTRPFVPTIPKSTVSEIAVIIKSLIWHLSKSSTHGLLQVLQVLHEMVLGTSYVIQTSYTGHRVGAGPETELASEKMNLLNLTPVDASLLLYHIATAAQQKTTADAAVCFLKSQNIDLDSDIKKLSRKTSPRAHDSVVKEENSQLSHMADVEEDNIKEKMKRKKYPEECELSDSQHVKSAQTRTIISDSEKTQLWKLFQDIVRATRTLEFV